MLVARVCCGEAKVCTLWRLCSSWNLPKEVVSPRQGVGFALLGSLCLPAASDSFISFLWLPAGADQCLLLLASALRFVSHLPLPLILPWTALSLREVVCVSSLLLPFSPFCPLSFPPFSPPPPSFLHTQLFCLFSLLPHSPPPSLLFPIPPPSAQLLSFMYLFYAECLSMPQRLAVSQFLSFCSGIFWCRLLFWFRNNLFLFSEGHLGVAGDLCGFI